jgi:hypothetical protein
MPPTLRLLTFRPRRHRPVGKPYDQHLLRRLIDDLQVLALRRPMAIVLIANLADYFAAKERA